MSDLFLASVRELESLSITFAPIFVAYVLGSRAWLQVWKDAQHVPPPQHSASMISAVDVKEAKKQYEKGLSARLFLFLYLLGTAMVGPIIVKLDETKRSDPRFARLYLASLFFPLLYIVANVIGYLLGLYERVAYRDEDEKLFILSQKAKNWSRRNVVSAYLMAAVVVYGAISLPSKTLASLIVASIVYTSTVNDPPQTFTAKRYIISALAMAVFFVVSAPIMVEFINMLGWFPAEGFLEDWSSLPLGSMLLSTPIELIALCYRFDHVSSITKMQAIRKPYFLSAMAGCLCTVIFIAVLRAVRVGFELSTYIKLGLCTTFLTPLLMAAAVAFTAILRGEGRKIWHYQEEWGFVGDKTESDIVLHSGHCEAGSGKAMDRDSLLA